MKSIRAFLLSILLCIGSLVHAQGWDFGFSGGVNVSILHMPQSIRDITDFKQEVGYRVGIMADKKLFPFLHFIPRADVVFNNSVLSFKDGVTPNYDVMPRSLNFSAHLRIEIESGKRDPFLVFGPNFKFPIQKNTTATNVFKTGHDIALDIGFGYSRNGLLFDTAPEIRYTYGFLDVSRNPQIEELYLHQISLVFSIF